MAVDDRGPWSWRHVEVLHAQGVLAQRLGVNIDQADRGLRRYSELTGSSLYDVAWLVVGMELLIARDLCA